MRDTSQVREWELDCDTRFMWNYNIVRSFVAQKVPSYWYIPLIQGYVDSQSPSDNIQMVLIARRRWRMGGTRYNARGIDEEGNVANYAEFEQIIYHTTRHNPPLQVQSQAEGVTNTVSETIKIYAHV